MTSLVSKKKATTLPPAKGKDKKEIVDSTPISEESENQDMEKQSDIPTLTDEQLNEEFNRVINASDARAPKKISRFHFKDSTYRDEPTIDQTAVHYFVEGTIALIGSEEARPVPADEMSGLIPQVAGSKDVSAHATPRDKGDATPRDPADAEAKGDDAVAEDGAEAADGGEEKKEEAAEDENAPPTKLAKNQFSYSERQSQTFNYGMREHECMTEPAPTAVLSGSATQWAIFDTYLEVFLAARSGVKDTKKKDASKDDKSTEGKSSSSGSSSGASVEWKERVMQQLLADSSFAAKVKTMERLVNQNAEEKLYHAIKYFDDEADAEKADGSGSLMPLFSFSYPPAKGRTVTALCWNPKYVDLFAVGYGSYDYAKSSASGMITCFSLKNPSFPEYVFTTSSGVMCLDFHPQHPQLLAVGFFDGTVAVYDVRSKTNAPIYVSKDPRSRHSEPVWSVRFRPDEVGKNINFVSVSSDGRVTNWIMNKNELVNEEYNQLRLTVPKVQQQNQDLNLSSSMVSEEKHDLGAKSASSSSSNEEEQVLGVAAGSTLDFNPKTETLYVVGTEQGALHKCSTSFTNTYIQSFDGHNMAVYSVAWNRFHPRVFMSCSADWTVKVWESQTSRAMMSFDLGASVGDVCWAPYSATVFSACTSEGKLFVFDLSVNKFEPLAEFKLVMPKSSRPGKNAAAMGTDGSSSSSAAASSVAPIIKCTKVSFNPASPVLLVGDDRGVITSFKLSPNLRRGTLKGWSTIDPVLEEASLEKLLIHATKNNVDP